MAKDYGFELARIAFDIGAIIVRPESPFEWASGFKMPVYNDNRLLLKRPEHRKLVAEGFEALIGEHGINAEVVAGVATAGIPHATTLANHLGKELIYVREKPKDHGLRNQIEGIGADETLEGRSVLVVEDLVSTGGSSAKAVEAVRKAGGKVDYLVSIFNYGFGEAAKLFVDANCGLLSLLKYDRVLEVGQAEGRIKKEDIATLEEWRLDPFNWGAKRGFPKREK